jgi:hypothetical protein
MYDDVRDLQGFQFSAIESLLVKRLRREISLHPDPVRAPPHSRRLVASPDV